MNILPIMHYTESVVNMQKPIPKQPHTLILDAVIKHQKEETLPKLKSLYHKTSGIEQKLSANLDSRNDMHAEKFYVAGVRRV